MVAQMSRRRFSGPLRFHSKVYGIGLKHSLWFVLVSRLASLCARFGLCSFRAVHEAAKGLRGGTCDFVRHDLLDRVGVYGFADWQGRSDSGRRVGQLPNTSAVRGFRAVLEAPGRFSRFARTFRVEHKPQ